MLSYGSLVVCSMPTPLQIISHYYPPNRDKTAEQVMALDKFVLSINQLFGRTVFIQQFQTYHIVIKKLQTSLKRGRGTKNVWKDATTRLGSGYLKTNEGTLGL